MEQVVGNQLRQLVKHAGHESGVHGESADAGQSGSLQAHGDGEGGEQKAEQHKGRGVERLWGKNVTAEWDDSGEQNQLQG